jgi:hypothetical protein
VKLGRQYGVNNLTDKCLEHQKQNCFFKAKTYSSWYYDEDVIKVGDIKVLSIFSGY